MAKGNPKRDADGVVWIENPGWPWLRTALGIVLVALLGLGGAWLLLPRPPAEKAAQQDAQAASPNTGPQPPSAGPQRRDGPKPPPAGPPRPEAPPVDPMERAMQQALAQHPLPPADDTPQDASPRPPPPGEPQEVTVDQLPKGDGTGLDAFPRPGTKPLRAGLVVPEDYALPPGYMRHYQTTDDGEQLPAILMYQPGFQPLGPDGRPLPVPPDRIVPRDLAPPGLGQWLTPPPVRRERK